MRYWSYLAAKLALSAAFLFGVWQALVTWLPEPQIFFYRRVGRHQDLGWLLIMLLVWLAGVGLLFLVVWDQRRRCRVCLRRLRMPVVSGTWGAATLFGPPRVSLICPYGHGTLDQPELHTPAEPPAAWHAHADIWTELESIHRHRP
jgi:hypothetical protein